jgi:hypothetical protein
MIQLMTLSAQLEMPYIMNALIRARLLQIQGDNPDRAPMQATQKNAATAIWIE